MKAKIKPIKDCKSLQELFADPNRWCKGTFARNKKGAPTDNDSKNAVAFCLIGGLMRIYTYPDYNTCYYKISNRLHEDITDYNDDPERTAEDIQKLVKELDI